MAHAAASIARPPAAPLAERVEARYLLSLSGAVMPALADGDFDGDGSKETLVWVTAGRARLADLRFGGSAFRRGSLLLLDDSGGLLGRPLALRARGRTPPLVAAGDFNGDGQLDLVVGGRRVTGARRGLVLLAGNGDGTFADPLPVAGAPPTVTALLAADVNGDGRMDLVGTGRGGAFRTAAETATAAPWVDVDTDRSGMRAVAADTGTEARPWPDVDADRTGMHAVAPPADGSSRPDLAGAAAEAGGGRVAAFDNFFFDGDPIHKDRIFVLLNNDDGTFSPPDGSNGD